MKNDSAADSKVVDLLHQPCGAEGAFVLALREYLLAPATEAKGKKVELTALTKRIKGIRDFDRMINGLDKKDDREWARLLARSTSDEGYLVTHLSRRPDRDVKSAFKGSEAYNSLKEMSPFRGLNLVVIQSRQPSNRDDEREFFKTLIKEKLLECDTNKTYVLVFNGFCVELAEIFCFHPLELILDI